MENNEQPISIADIINNSKLRGSLYSTFRCSYCGGKMMAQVAGNEIYFSCENYIDPKSYIDNNGKYMHDSYYLNLIEIAALLNFNPLL